ncbi:DUF433 domain-containing protein [Robertkochia solimangrovi]|uniref:DUF433 domain-containing protein n=1 Tax=Robertkochia solimangrovi TaxID=2213046 RepID=UPI00117E8094|nr:DUF433 domain-containing protein [Robertkochia solimangrovi]TRZ41664.1 DUF433 domain-containing protein [Robertkochia solimangrovi]
MDFENQPTLGQGIYTASEISQILRLPYSRIYTWMNKYWDGKLGDEYGARYSWKSEGSKAVSFHTFVEFYVMMQFSEAGVKPKKVLQAHKALSDLYDTPFPFAIKSVLEGIRSDGNHIYLNTIEGIISLDGTRQFNLKIIDLFFVKLEFDQNELASRFWPLGKDKSILIDPSRKFGHPVIDGKNITPDIIFNHFKAGDPVPYIAHVYQLTEEEVNHAVEYCNAA